MSTSYEPCSCGADCPHKDENSDEPCWGPVQAGDEWYTDDDYGWYHACEGHHDVVSEGVSGRVGKYIKETTFK